MVINNLLQNNSFYFMKNIQYFLFFVDIILCKAKIFFIFENNNYFIQNKLLSQKNILLFIKLLSQNNILFRVRLLFYKKNFYFMKRISILVKNYYPLLSFIII